MNSGQSDPIFGDSCKVGNVNGEILISFIMLVRPLLG